MRGSDVGERLVRANGVDLCVETFGDPGGATILLVAGAATAMDWWEVEFCERLAAGGRHVVRYDARDTGRSVSSPPGEPDYTGADLREDAIGLLDALGVERAHLVGISMGGALAQELGVTHPDRLATLTAIATTSAFGFTTTDATGAEPPPPVERVRASFADPAPEPDWTSRDDVTRWFLEAERLFAGSLPIDEERIRRIVGSTFDRTPAMATAQNHWSLPGGKPVEATLADIGLPTLILHGTEDPLFPLTHGRALAREIPNARLIELGGLGHQMIPPPLWPTAVPALLEHTA